MLAGIVKESGHEFGVGACDAGRGFGEAFAVGIFTDGENNLAHRTFNTRQIDLRGGGVAVERVGLSGGSVCQLNLRCGSLRGIIRRRSRKIDGPGRKWTEHRALR
jgi:hypothetical protein